MRNYITPTPTPASKPYELEEYMVHPPRVGGTFSTVSLAYCEDTGEAVAMKKMKRDKGNSKDIQQEIDILKRLKHVRDSLGFWSFSDKNVLAEHHSLRQDDRERYSA